MERSQFIKMFSVCSDLISSGRLFTMKGCSRACLGVSLVAKFQSRHLLTKSTRCSSFDALRMEGSVLDRILFLSFFLCLNSPSSKNNFDLTPCSRIFSGGGPSISINKFIC